MKVFLVCVLVGLVLVSQLDARGVVSRAELVRPDVNCTEYCHNKYPNGGQGLIDLCLTVCEMDKNGPHALTEDIQENVGGNPYCTLKCHKQYPNGGPGLIQLCIRLCELEMPVTVNPTLNPTEAAQNDDSHNRFCLALCHQRFPGQPKQVAVCVRKCTTERWAPTKSPTEVQEDHPGSTPYCVAMCHVKFSGRPGLIAVCIRRCENGESLPTVPPTELQEDDASTGSPYCTIMCNVKYSGRPGLIAVCIRKCENEGGLPTENPTGPQEHVQGDSSCVILCHHKFPGNPHLIEACIRRCRSENIDWDPTKKPPHFNLEDMKNEVLSEWDDSDTRSCSEICHERYPNGGQGLIKFCIRVCEMERGVFTVNPTLNPTPPQFAVEYITNELNLQESEPGESRNCTEICQNKCPWAGPVLMHICVGICEKVTQGTTPPIYTINPTVAADPAKVAHAGDKK